MMRQRESSGGLAKGIVAEVTAHENPSILWEPASVACPLLAAMLLIWTLNLVKSMSAQAKSSSLRSAYADRKLRRSIAANEAGSLRRIKTSGVPCQSAQALIAPAIASIRF